MVQSHSLGEPDEVFVVGVHVGQFHIDQKEELVFGFLFPFPYVRCDNAFSLFSQVRVSSHLLCTSSDHIAQFHDDKIDTLERWFPESAYLFLDNSIKCHVWSEETHSDPVDVPDSIGDLLPQLLLIELHLDYLEREPFMEESVDPGSTRQFGSVDGSRSRSLNRPFKISLHLLDHLQHRLRLPCWIIWSVVLKLLHILLQCQQLLLQTISKGWKGISDVIRQLLVQCPLQVRCPHPVRPVSQEVTVSVGCIKSVSCIKSTVSVGCIKSEDEFPKEVVAGMKCQKINNKNSPTKMN